MLCLQGVVINLQNFGTIFGVFLTGTDVVAVQQRYFSFFNHGATSGDLEWWSPTTALFWVSSTKTRSAYQKLKNALTRAALFEILDTRDTKGSNPWPEACLIGEGRLNAIERVSWLVARALNLDIYSLADSVSAESGTGNFDDDVLTSTLTAGKAALGLSQYIEDPSDLDNETESASEGVQLASANEINP